MEKPRIITRQQAKEANLVRYFTGKKCRLRNHIAERYTVNGICVECNKIKRFQKHVKEHKAWDYEFTQLIHRIEALFELGVQEDLFYMPSRREEQRVPHTMNNLINSLEYLMMLRNAKLMKESLPIDIEIDVDEKHVQDSIPDEIKTSRSRTVFRIP